MKLVVDIDEEYYTALIRDVFVNGNDYQSAVILANGKPLSAGRRKEKNGDVLNAVKENIDILQETDMDSLGKMNAHLLNITMVLCDMSRSMAFMADNEMTVKE